MAEEKRSLAAILNALEGSAIKKVVAESAYGARSGDAVGDLGVLYSMEQSLAEMNIPADIIRGAYYMSNWAASVDTVRETGKLNTLYPPDFKLPMVAPEDIGQFAAGLMLRPLTQTGLHFIERPQQYSPTDVANAFATVLQKPVEAIQTPKDQWVKTLKDVGFSQKAAESMVTMTEITLENQHENPENPVRVETTLQDYMKELI